MYKLCNFIWNGNPVYNLQSVLSLCTIAYDFFQKHCLKRSRCNMQLLRIIFRVRDLPSIRRLQLEGTVKQIKKSSETSHLNDEYDWRVWQRKMNRL